MVLGEGRTEKSSGVLGLAGSVILIFRWQQNRGDAAVHRDDQILVPVLRVLASGTRE